MENIPQKMTAVRIYEFGGPEVLKVETHPVPMPGARQVLIRVKASSVSWWDYAYRNKLFTQIQGRGALPMPQQLGREASGDIVCVGKAAYKFKPGTKVVTMTCPACGQCEFCQQGFDNLCIATELPAHGSYGGYAEYIVRDEDAVYDAPEHLTYDQLACVLWSYGTVQHMISGRAKLRVGESVLITGASGGLGTAAIQLAKLAGASEIIALSSATDKYESLRQAGATAVLNYKDADIAQQIRAQTKGNMGVDVVLDNVGGAMAELGIEAVKMGGRIVLAAIMGGNTMELNVLKVFVKNISIMGARAARRQDQKLVLRLAAEGKIMPIISHRFHLSEVVAASKLLESGKFTGKIVLYM